MALMMSETFKNFWWLIFPVMSFALAGFNRWTRYKRQHDAIELLRTYAANGREPPPEVLNLLTGATGLGSSCESGWGRNSQAQGLWGGTFILGSLSAGFFIADHLVHSDGGFQVVGVILGSLSIGMLLYAVTTTYLTRAR